MEGSSVVVHMALLPPSEEYWSVGCGTRAVWKLEKALHRALHWSERLAFGDRWVNGGVVSALASDKWDRDACPCNRRHFGIRLAECWSLEKRGCPFRLWGTDIAWLMASYNRYRVD